MSGVFLIFSIVVFYQSISAQNVKPNDNRSSVSSGNPNAVARIEVFYDLQCGPCVSFHSILKNVENKFRDNVLITFRHFPLRIPTHDKSFLAAKVVEAAHVQGKGRKMLDMVLANQTEWTANPQAKSILFSYARKLRLDMKRFRDDLENEEILHKIVGDVVNANELKLTSTPTVFLNGKQLTHVEALEIETKLKDIVK